MFGFFKKNKKSEIKGENLTDENGNLVKESSLIKSKNGRFLKLQDDCCAIILYPDNNVEVIFTKLYDSENQRITENEESLMALALFIKQPGFLEMIKKEFRKIAMEKITNLTDIKNRENKNDH